MQDLTLDLFSKLPAGIFRPLASANQKLYWKVLVRLFHSYFDEDAKIADQNGHARVAIVDTITAVVEQNAILWIEDIDSNEVLPDTRNRGNQVYYYIRNAGWLEESRYGYSDYVTMPPRVNQLLSVLIEISEGRALIMTGKLKSLRSDMRETLADPENAADLLTEATKDAKRFARHLGSIRGSIKSLYDQIKGNVPAREIVSTFFDDFLKDILIRDYATIKTTENPLSIRDELLRVVSTLRYDINKKAMLLKGYQRLYVREPENNAALYMEKDLSQLETVFSHIDNQLDAIDSMKLMYEQRIDTVIDYASKTPRVLGRNINRLIQALVRHAEVQPDVKVTTPLIIGEKIGEDRFAKPRLTRTSPKPRALVKAVISPELIVHSSREREARLLIHVDADAVVDFLNRQIGPRRTFESQELKPDNIQDYFCILALQRAACSHAFDDREFRSLFRVFNLSMTDDWVENEYVHSRMLILTRKDQNG